MVNLIVIWSVLAILLFDLWLVFSKRPTISQWYQAKFRTSVDMVLMITAMCIIVNLPLHPITICTLGVLTGHLFWPNKERWR